MIKYTNEQLATVIAVPIVTILLVWTTAIFHKNRKKWGPYDIPVVTVIVLSIIRNLTILSYTLIIILNQSTFNLEYCSIVIWIFNSIHTFQASSLTTLAIIGLFSAKLTNKNQNVRQFLTSTHVIYHIFCLTTLCACVGVAAILAQNDRDSKYENLVIFESNPCKFMPFELDIKFNVFVIVLHVFLAVISFIALLIVCYNYIKFKRNGFDYLKKSNSDLSDLSLGLPNGFNGGDNKNFYDTYTIHRNGGGNQMENGYFDHNGVVANHNNYQNGYCHRDAAWNSDMSNISTTVSSTNSRRPCLNKPPQEEFDSRTGLETIHPVLIVCYLFYHLPLIVLCIYPKLIRPWPVSGVALWLGLIQDLLIPIGLGLIDSRFSKWVSNVYKCSGRNDSDKLPHVGLDGKFRPFGSSQPQSLEIGVNPLQDRSVRNLQTVEHRFPITNGSLYTSIDGRLPVIHNYRRHKELRVTKQEVPNTNLGYATQSKKENYLEQSYPSGLQHQYCRNCETDLCPSHSNLHHLSPHYINKQLSFIQQNNNILLNRNPLQKRITLSQESLKQIPENRFIYRPEINNPVLKSSRNLVRLNKMRLSKSEDSLPEIQRNFRELKENPISVCQYSKRSLNENILDYSSSDDEYMTEPNERNFDTLSSKSCYSITTEANGDFEFFQNNDNNNENNGDLFSKQLNNITPSLNVTNIEINSSDINGSKNSLDINHNFKITRSNSKRSLENFQAFIEETEFQFNHPNKIQRSNSYMTLEDRKRKRNCKKLLRSNSKLSDCTHNIKQKIKSVEYLPSSNASTVYIEDTHYYNLHNRKNGDYNNYIGSVPDFKKVFISEYI